MRVLIADDGCKVRFALQVLLDSQPGLEVVGQATYAQDLSVQVEATEPDLVLLAWELSGLDALGSIPALREVRPHLMVIVLSGRPEARQAALDAGADVFVSKTDPPEHLLAAIQVCGHGKHRAEDDVKVDKSATLAYEPKLETFVTPVRPGQEEKKQ
jgi:DNA-binding NarL/FixJ family response regulator